MIKTIIFASISSFILGFFGVSWDEVDQKIEKEFPLVEFISTDALYSQMQTQQVPLIVDVREVQEYEVSHLQHARNLSSGEAVSLIVADKNAAIVVYCSVGYRSAAVAAELESLGYTNVLNLKHSIFEWANKGLPLENQAGATLLAHPFNQAWGSLLEQGLHAYSKN